MIIIILFIFTYFAFEFFGIPGYLGFPAYALFYLLLFYLKWRFSEHNKIWRLIFLIVDALTAALIAIGIGYFCYEFWSCNQSHKTCFFQLLTKG